MKENIYPIWNVLFKNIQIIYYLNVTEIMAKILRLHASSRKYGIWNLMLMHDGSKQYESFIKISVS